MAWELEEVIARLVVIISCAGEQGCPATELADATKHLVTNDVVSKQLPPPPADATNDATATLWKWLAQRNDISVGPERKYNHLTLEEVLNTAPILPSQQKSQLPDIKHVESGQPLESHCGENNVSETREIYVYASEQTMWEAITGHEIDYKRVPRSEWLLLLGIASTKSDGILQGDLGRLVDQDKRSVPKRTDALQKKGYIAKRTTLVRGTKTSKIWLKSFAPILPTSGFPKSESQAVMNLSRSVLVANLDPVPWRTRWTGSDIDYTALATTIMAITREWGVIRLQHLKIKLGVVGMRWQMKVVSKVCRFLNAIGGIQYIAAQLHSRVFKDCIRFMRDLNESDWTIFLATGKRISSQTRFSDGNPEEDGDADDSSCNVPTSVSNLTTTPPWSADKPLAAFISHAVQISGRRGLTNPDIYAITIGPSFTRYLSTLTTYISSANTASLHLGHLKMHSERIRTGKIASYRYFLLPKSLERSEVDITTRNIHANELFGKRPPEPKYLHRYGYFVHDHLQGLEPDASFEEICGLAKASGRENKNRQKPTITMDDLGDWRRTVVEANDKRQQENTQQSRATNCPPTLIITMKPGRKHLERLQGQTDARRSQTPEVAPETETGSKSSVLPSNGTLQTIDGEIGLPNHESAFVLGRGRGRGRGRTGGRGRGRGRGKRQNQQAFEGHLNTESDTKPWKCPNCGGSWKNDLGLKYHLEKSKTRCNPSYVQPNESHISESDEGSFHKEATTTRAGRAAVHDKNDEVNDDDSLITAHAEKRQRKSSRDSTGNLQIATDLPEWTPWKHSALPRSAISDTHDDAINSGPLLLETALVPRAAIFMKRQNLKFGKLPEQAKALSVSNGGHVGEDSIRASVTTTSTSPMAESAQVPLESRSATEDSPPYDYDIEPQTTSGQISDGSFNEVTTVKASRNLGSNLTRVCSLIQDLLSKTHGVFPSGESLTKAIFALWATKFFNVPSPTMDTCHSALQSLLVDKIVVEHCHAFRTKKGSFSKCHIIAWPSIDACSTAVLQIVGKVKQAYPQIYTPSIPGLHNTPTSQKREQEHKEQRKESGRGRRQLGPGLAMLNAPLYASQAAAMREVEASYDTPHQVKKQIRAITKVADDSRSVASVSTPTKKQRLLQASQKSIDIASGNELTHTPTAYSHRTGVLLLPINTFLDEEVPDIGSLSSDQINKLQTRKRNTFKEINIEQPSTLPKTYHFEPPTYVTGINGSWSVLDMEYFEQSDTSFTLDGWFPDFAWFKWASITENIEKRSPRLFNKWWPTTDVQHHHFAEKLLACADFEMSWAQQHLTDPCIQSTAPFNIFVNFHAHPNVTTWCQQYAPTAWPVDGQLTSSTIYTDNDDHYEWDSSSSLSDEIEAVEPAATKLVNKPRESTNRHRGASYSAKIKRVNLMTRHLTALPAQGDRGDRGTGSDDVEDSSYLCAAFIVVRILLGGTDKDVDWGLLVKLFPRKSLESLRRFWIQLRKDQSQLIAKQTQVVQERLILAFENEVLPIIDYGNTEAYDWRSLIKWATLIPHQDRLRIPKNRELLHKEMPLEKIDDLEEDWRERYFHVQSSIYSRFEAATMEAAAISVDSMKTLKNQTSTISQLNIAKSWIKALCCTEDAKYSAQQIKAKFLTLSKNDWVESSSLLQDAIDDLTRQRVISKSRKSPLGGRPYRLSEYYTSILGKIAQREKYEDAASLKAEMDSCFRSQGNMELPYTLSDGAVLALTNLNATGRIKLMAKDLPEIPFGFEPGNYESRKYPKSYYHFGLIAVPTASYLYNPDIAALTTAAECPPLEGERGKLPQWVDFFGEYNSRRWADILGAFYFAFATRGSLTIEGVCAMLKPTLETFEAQLIVSWSKKNGIIREVADSMGLAVREWWWLVISHCCGRITTESSVRSQSNTNRPV